MKWTLNEPKFGDIVRVKLGSIYHFGIYISDDSVIQFGLPPTSLDRDASKVFVCETSIETFLCDKFLEVGEPDKQEKKKIRKPKDIVSVAKSRLGEGGYHILYNNCEHFVNECAFGKRDCEQVDSIRKMWQNFNLIDIYIKKYPFKVKDRKIFPEERKKEIDDCKNKDISAEKFYVWKLLEYAIQQSLNRKIKDFNFYKKGSKWVCDEFEFSLSHTNNIVVVAISKKPIGIDIEKIDNRFEKIPLNRILTEEERVNKDFDWQELNRIWTVKEALFKKNSGEYFNPAKVNTINEKYVTKVVCNKEEQYYVSVASNDAIFAKFHIDDDLLIKK